VAFEPWLRARLRAPNESASDEGVAVSTVHRVKGMEWPYVVVLGAHEGLMPHALADDIEENGVSFTSRSLAPTPPCTSWPTAARPRRSSTSCTHLHPPTTSPAGRYDARRSERHPRSRCPPTGRSALVAALKDWRRQRAASDKVPAYVVLSDAHLNGSRRARRQRSPSSRGARESVRRSSSATATRSWRSSPTDLVAFVTKR
jgi:DNA helicase-2/ATP-dependent DNA helicase PcrA